MFALFLGTVVITALVLLVLFNYRTRKGIERYSIRAHYHVDDPLFLRSMSGILSTDLSPGNHVQTLNNGEEIFSSMLAAIKQAQVSITLESFVCASGKVFQRFSDALCERAKAGVKVHILLDWMGSTDLETRDVEKMQEAGIQIVKYRKLHWYTLARLNYRSHRKILVIDGKMGFTGGIGIADEWLYEHHGKPAWRDIHYRLEGPIVAKMQAAFLENWLKSHRAVLEGESYFPALTPRGNISCQLFTSSADGIEAVRLMYMLSIACAKKHLRIINAYFVPDGSFIHALVKAAHRGVQVEIIVPGAKTDQLILRHVSRSTWRKLLQAGVKIYEYQPTMHHGKLFIVDDSWTSIGSANCDGRSFAMNDEMNINVDDQSFAKEQIILFEKDKDQSKQITYQQWKKRPLWGKIVGNAGRIISRQF